MLKSTASAILTALSSFFFFFLISSTPEKSHYHSLFLSPSFSSINSISTHLRTLTRRPHVAGSAANSEAANYVLSVFTTSGVESHMAAYHVSLTYPVYRSLILSPQESEMPITFLLKQENYGLQPYATEVLPTFHGYAKSGNVSGPVVYANYGRVEDYVTLKDIGVNVKGAVVLARYGQIYRGDIVQNAYEAGAIGVVIYTDKKDYGGDKWFPEDKWMPPTGVQVGTVYNGLGDPTTPGWASVDGCERLSDEEVEKSGDVPKIPSLPVSSADGEMILRTIGGQVAKKDWQGREDFLVYHVGPGPGVLNLNYMVRGEDEFTFRCSFHDCCDKSIGFVFLFFGLVSEFQGEKVIAKIENVIGVIKGAEEPDRYILNF